MLGFVTCIFISKIIIIVAAENTWCIVKTIKSGKRSTIINKVSYKHSIIYTYECIEQSRLGWMKSDCNIYECYTKHVWNDDDEVFDHQLEK